jgi:hypothetical protein
MEVAFAFYLISARGNVVLTCLLAVRSHMFMYCTVCRVSNQETPSLIFANACLLSSCIMIAPKSRKTNAARREKGFINLPPKLLHRNLNITSLPHKS